MEILWSIKQRKNNLLSAHTKYQSNYKPKVAKKFTAKFWLLQKINLEVKRVHYLLILQSKIVVWDFKFYKIYILISLNKNLLTV